MRTFLQDLRYGIRTAIGQPGYSLLIALTLALAIGANTVIFSFTNVLLVRPLPVRDQGVARLGVHGQHPAAADPRADLGSRLARYRARRFALSRTSAAARRELTR